MIDRSHTGVTRYNEFDLMKIMRHLGLFFLLLPGVVASQCRIDTNIQLREVDTLNLTIDIEGALNNDLSDPDQGLCKVRVNFEHEFLGDLQVFIESPSGQMVQLMGPTGNFGLTQFSTWDVCFLPNSEPVSPDAGFNDRWSNNQLWGAFAGTYTGSYHVFFGDLADLDTGPVNGTWTLRFVDRTIFYVGKVLGFELSFCDSTGVMCQPCQPGSFDLEVPDRIFCEGDSLLDFTVDTEYSDQPDSILYEPVIYVVDSTDLIRDIGRNVKLSDASPGTYRICGLSYYLPHDPLLPGVGDNWEKFRDSTQKGDIAICYGFMGCQQIRIRSHSDTTRITETICRGDTIDIFDDQYFETGRYVLKDQNLVGCDSVVLLELTVVDFVPEVVLDTLDCINSTVILDGSASIGPAGFTMEWSTDQGMIEDTLDEGIIRVSQSGQYTLVLSAGQCTDSLVVEVIEDDEVPQLEILGDTLNCTNTSVVLYSTTSADQPTYQWQFGGNIVGDDDSLFVDTAGMYQLTVTDDNGCSKSQSFRVVVDSVSPDPEVRVDSITCLSDTAEVFLLDSLNFQSVQWEGPGNFTSFQSRILLDEPGTFVVTVEAENGCVDSLAVEVRDIRDFPMITFKTDTITCQNEEADIVAIPNMRVSSYEWEGPGGFISEDSSVTVVEPGLYRLSVTGENGCEVDTAIEILSERELLDLRLFADSLECGKSSPKAWYTVEASFQNSMWTTPSGQQVATDSVLLDREGFYRLLVTTPKGCIYADSIFITDYRNVYDAVLNGGKISCKDDSVTVAARTGVGKLDYTWFYSGRQVGADSAILVGQAGWYSVVIEDSSDCQYSDSILVVADTSSPDIRIMGDSVLSCSELFSEIRIESDSILSNIQWVGPNGLLGDDRVVRIDQPGLYVVSAEASNGCVAYDSLLISQDTTKPAFDITGGTITCDQSTVILEPTRQENNWRFEWILPNSDTSEQLDLEVTVPGTYALLVTNEGNGCRTLRSIEILSDTMTPEVNVRDTSLACPSGEIMINFESPDSIRMFEWVYPDSSIVDISDPTVDMPGVYSLHVTGMNGCTNSTSLLVRPAVPPNAQTFNDTISCIDDTAVLRADLSDDVDSIYWYSEEGYLSTDQSPTVLEGGTYKLVVIGKNQCRDTLPLLVFMDTLRPSANIDSSGILGCSSTVVTLRAVADGMNADRYGYHWESIMNPGSVSNPGNEQVQIDQAGSYVLITQDLVNGCITTDTIEVNRLSSDLVLAGVTARDPSCKGGQDGRIILGAISGGIDPINVILNGSQYSDIQVFDSLVRGRYDFHIEDAAGCGLDTVIVLNDGPELILDVGPDTLISLGDTITLRPQEYPAQWTGLFWTPDENINDVNMLNPAVSPNTTTTYRLTMINQAGCEVWDELVVRVDDEIQVFVPNIFSPNGDGINDRFLLYPGKGVEDIIDIRIFDRWGEMAYYSSVNDGWDGTMNGRQSPEGVYVILAQIRGESGNNYVISKDITLIR